MVPGGNETADDMLTVVCAETPWAVAVRVTTPSYRRRQVHSSSLLSQGSCCPRSNRVDPRAAEFVYGCELPSLADKQVYSCWANPEGIRRSKGSHLQCRLG